MNARLSFLLVLFMSTAMPSYADEVLKVGSFDPSPNYSATTDANDLLQATDGLTEKYPLWTKVGGIGWNQKTPVSTRIQFLTHTESSDLPGTLGVHVGKGTGAAVNLPVRIDVYAIDGSNAYSHVGALQVQSSDYPDKASHWINVPVRRHTEEMLVISHADGRYLMMDEIRWTSGVADTSTLVAVSAPLTTPELVVKDSSDRLKGYSQEAANDIQANIADQLSSGTTTTEPVLREIAAWVVPAYEPDLNAYSASNASTASKYVEVFGISRERESTIIAVMNLASETKHITIAPSLTGRDPGLVAVKRVEKVVAANGKEVFDPLVPLPDASIDLEPSKIAYFWVEFDLSKAPLGKTELNIVFADGKTPDETVTASLNVTNLADTAGPLRVNVYSYPDDFPIWSVAEPNLSALLKHGVNVHTVHRLPEPDITGYWSKMAEGMLLDDMGLFKGKGLILVHPGWPARIPDVVALPDSEQKPLIQNWVKSITSLLAAAGYDYDEWALYPVDEAMGAKMHFLKKAVVWIKEADPKVKLYANPMTSSTSVTNTADLTALAPYIDYWQPRLPLAIKEKAFFQALGKPWWVYNNPNAPAKAAEPLGFRKQAWEAWRLGAVGVGTWSYSDSRDTSVWDDFDGDRADWALVYESSIGPVSSRRWEAFRDGQEDYALLRSLGTYESASALLPGIINDALFLDGNFNPAAVAAVRKSLFGG